MLIRRADVTDAGACRAIYAPAVTTGWTSFEEEVPTIVEMEERIRRSLDTHEWLVVQRGDQIVGYAYGSEHRTRSAYRSSCDVAVYVGASDHRTGLGSALYGRLLPCLGMRGFHAAFAGIALPNPASVALHERHGFEPVGVYREVGWKAGAWRDVGWWQRRL